jgi:hypothetical protein
VLKEVKNMAKSTFKAESEALSKAASTLKMRVEVSEEKDDTIIFLVGTSLLEIPRESILSMTEVEGAEGPKVVDVSIDREAKIIQKTLVTAESVIGAVTGDIFGVVPKLPGYCYCYCSYCHYCYCYCSYCVCPQAQEASSGITTSFRSPVRTKSGMI